MEIVKMRSGVTKTEEHRGVSCLDSLSNLDTLTSIGFLFAERGWVIAAEKTFSQALEAYEDLLRPHRPSTSRTINNITLVERDQSKSSGGKESLQRPSRDDERMFGRSSMSSLDVATNVDHLHRSSDKLSGDVILSQVGKCYQQARLPDHTLIAKAMNNISIFYSEQGNSKEAKEILLRVIKAYKQILDPKHTLILELANNIGVLCLEQGDLEEAEERLLSTLAGKIEVLGANHTSTLSTYGNLGNLYSMQGRLEEATDLLWQVMRGYEDNCGKQHVSTTRIAYNLGMVYSKQKRSDEAEQMFSRAVCGYEKVWSSDHPLTLDAVMNLGDLYKEKGEISRAKEMYTRAVAGYKNADGDHTEDVRFLEKQLSLLVGL
jgi:tetratricopeptide (TPR) repeat protein